MAAKSGPLAPPEFFDFPSVDVDVRNQKEVNRLLDRVFEIVFGGDGKTVRGVYVRTKRQRPQKAHKAAKHKR
jgi:hypothetical protein